MKPGSELFGEKIVENIEFPYNLNKEIIEKILVKTKNKESAALSMYL